MEALQTIQKKLDGSSFQLGKKTNEIINVASGLIPREIQFKLDKDQLLISIIYAIQETSKNIDHLLNGNIRILVGKYTHKIIGISISYQNKQELELSYKDLIAKLSDMKKDLASESLRLTYSIITQALTEYYRNTNQFDKYDNLFMLKNM